MTSNYDAWKTSPPDPEFGTCYRCGESEEDHVRFPRIGLVCPPHIGHAQRLARIYDGLEMSWESLDQEIEDIMLYDEDDEDDEGDDDEEDDYGDDDEEDEDIYADRIDDQ